jgi:hypothetical protein
LLVQWKGKHCRTVREARRVAWVGAAMELGCQAIVGDLDRYTFEGPGGADASGESGTAGAASFGEGGARSVLAPECGDGARQCLGDGVQTCANGSWGEAEPCTASTPVCNGGVCGAVRLSGGLVSVSGSLVAGNYRLVAHGFEAVSSLCGDVNRQRVCVTGVIRP